MYSQVQINQDCNMWVSELSGGKVLNKEIEQVSTSFFAKIS